MVCDADGSIRFLRMVRASVNHHVRGYCTGVRGGVTFESVIALKSILF